MWPASRVKEFFVLAGGSPLGRRFDISIVRVLTLHVIPMAAHHRRSLHRPRPPCYLADLTLYEPPLLGTLGKLPIESLEAPLLSVQPAREGVEASERSAFEPALELAFCGLSGPPQRQVRRTLLLDGLARIEEFLGRHAQGSS